MAVTLNNIKFYRPPSLPARPLKSTSPNHNPTSFPHHPSKRADFIPAHSTLPFSPSSQPALTHSLPPRPPATIPSSHHTTSATLHSPSITSNTADSHSVCRNDFDRALDDFSSAKNSKKEEDREPSNCLPTQDHRNENHTQTTLPEPGISIPTTASLLSSSCTLLKPVESPAEANPTHPKPRDESQPREQPNDLACTTSMDTSPTFCTSEPHTPAPREPNHDSTHTTIQVFAQNSSVPNQECSETSHENSVPIHRTEPSRATSGNESMDFQESSGESERASSWPPRDLSKRKRSPSAHLSCPPTPLVVIPALSCSASLREKSSPQSSDRLQYLEQIIEDRYESDSAPSDDENDADYLDHSETEDASESLHPSKRRRKGPGDVSSASGGVLKHLISEIPPPEQPESPQEDSSPESEPIPIQGFLRLRTRGSEVVYSLEFSQSHFPSIFAGKQMECPRQHPRTAYPTTKTLYSPAENELIIQLKAQNLSWDEIEDQFAERFPRRPKTSLQVHYCNKLKHLTKESRKRRVKSCK